MVKVPYLGVQAMALTMSIIMTVIPITMSILVSGVAMLQVRNMVQCACNTPRWGIYVTISLLLYKVLPLNCSDGDIQLIDGDTNLEGRVEVCYGTQWYAVCADTTWITDTSGASIVCQQLGYSPINATPYQFPLFRPGLYDLLLSYVHCDARNNRLIDCSHNITYCYSGFAGVRCQGKKLRSD